MRYPSLFTAAVLVCLVLAAGPVRAFDTQPHFDITRDALAAEGFGNTAIQVVQVSNWFNDLYENPGANPYSGHAPWYSNLISGSYGNRENWSQAVRTAAARVHFDSDSNVPDTAAVEREWTRLARATRATLQDRAGAQDMEGILTVLGITLHIVQDFYTHSNWVEPYVDATYLHGGPGWAALARHGSHPTWFDVPAAERNRHRIYTHGPRVHGAWNSNNNENLSTAMNKDWAGRPLHQDAYVTAYVASRQWVRAAKAWMGNDALWAAVLQFSNRHGRDLDHDILGTQQISYYSGHWNGNGEPSLADYPGPGGSLDDLRTAIRDYFEPSGLSITGSTKTAFRKKWEAMILPMDARTPPAVETPVPSSLQIRTSVEFVVVEITKIREVDDRDLGSLDEADWYSTASVGGQAYTSGSIFGHDDFDFLKKPYGPFTYIKSLPVGTAPVPITLRLFDEDGGLYGDDDHCDISPVDGRKDLRVTYDRHTGAIAGDVSGSGSITVRGRGDDDVAEITFRANTLRFAPPATLPQQRAVVTFESVRLVDATRPGGQGKLFVTFDVNGQTLRYPAAGTLDAAIGSVIPLPAGTRRSANLRPDAPLVVSVRVTDGSRLVTLQAPDVPEPSVPRLRRAPAPGPGSPGGGATQVPLSVAVVQTYSPGQNYGESPQPYTVRGTTFQGAYLEVVYRIDVQNVRTIPDGRLDVGPIDTGPGVAPEPSRPTRPPVRPGVGRPR